MYKRLIMFVTIALPLFSKAQESATPSFPPLTFVNRIEYKENKFSKDTLGNGFLVQYGKQVYAVTAKHILMMAKTDKMLTVQMNDQLLQWTMYSKNDETQKIVIDKVVNESSTDSLNWNYFGKYYLNYPDWLVMSVKQNETSVKALEIRTTPLEVGEPLYAIGWTDADISGEQRVYEYSYLKENPTNLFLRIVKDAENSFGLSGSPVVDKNGLLVGVVSLSDRDPVTNEMYFIPCKASVLLSILDTLAENQ